MNRVLYDTKLTRTFVYAALQDPTKRRDVAYRDSRYPSHHHEGGQKGSGDGLGSERRAKYDDALFTDDNFIDDERLPDNESSGSPHSYCLDMPRRLGSNVRYAQGLAGRGESMADRTGLLAARLMTL